MPKRVSSSRPYLKEAVADGGDEFSIASFAGVLLFVFVIGSWLYSARGVVGGLLHYVIGDQPAFSIPAVADAAPESPTLFHFTDESGTPVPAPGPVEGEKDVVEELPAGRSDVRRTAGGSTSLARFLKSLGQAPLVGVIAILVCSGGGFLLLGLGVYRLQARQSPNPLTLSYNRRAKEGTAEGGLGAVANGPQE